MKPMCSLLVILPDLMCSFLAADKTHPAPWLGCFPWRIDLYLLSALLAAWKKKRKPKTCFIAKHRRLLPSGFFFPLIFKCLDLKGLTFLCVLWGAIREEFFNPKKRRSTASKLTSPLNALILISIFTPLIQKQWHSGGFNHPCIFSSYPGAVIYFQNRVQEALWEWDDSYVLQLQLWSVIADGYQCFPLIRAQRGKKIPPVGGRYLLPVFGLSSCSELKVSLSSVCSARSGAWSVKEE